MSEEFLPKPFSCEVAHDDGAARVRPAGELDISTVPVLEGHLRQAHADGSRHVIVEIEPAEPAIGQVQCDLFA